VWLFLLSAFELGWPDGVVAGDRDRGSSEGVGGASLRGGIRSLMASKPLASANEAILWLGEKPWSAVGNIEGGLAKDSILNVF
jgi:hypothetical protein